MSIWEGRIFISKDVMFNENNFLFKVGFHVGDQSGPISQTQQVQFPANLLQTSSMTNIGPYTSCRRDSPNVPTTLSIDITSHNITSTLAIKKII